MHGSTADGQGQTEPGVRVGDLQLRAPLLEKMAETVRSRALERSYREMQEKIARVGRHRHHRPVACHRDIGLRGKFDTELGALDVDGRTHRRQVDGCGRGGGLTASIAAPLVCADPSTGEGDVLLDDGHQRPAQCRFVAIVEVQRGA